jgi:GNAT superfamily N-acetyltransferase
VISLTVEYRKATVDDLDELLIVRLDFLREMKKIGNEKDEKQLMSTVREFLGTSLAGDDYTQFVAVEDNKIIGTSSVSFYFLPPNVKHPSGKVGYVANMFTYPEHRRKGVGTELFSLSVEAAKDAGCSEVSLDATEMGRTVYEKYGFEVNEKAMIYFISSDL